MTRFTMPASCSRPGKPAQPARQQSQRWRACSCFAQTAAWCRTMWGAACRSQPRDVPARTSSDRPRGEFSTLRRVNGCGRTAGGPERAIARAGLRRAGPCRPGSFCNDAKLGNRCASRKMFRPASSFYRRRVFINLSRGGASITRTASPASRLRRKSLRRSTSQRHMRQPSRRVCVRS